jgi:hypothetical protein
MIQDARSHEIEIVTVFFFYSEQNIDIDYQTQGDDDIKKIVMTLKDRNTEIKINTIPRLTC